MRAGLAILAGVNLLLMTALFTALRRPPGSGDPASSADVTGDHWVNPADPESASGPQPSDVPPAFDWSLAQAADLHPLVAALREVGCPATTLEDIIVAEVNRRFTPRERALKLRSQDYDLWDPPPPSQASLRRRQVELLALWEEKRALLRDLLGVDVALEEPAALVPTAGSRNESAYQALPETKRAAVKDVHERFRQAVERIRAESYGFLSEEDLVKLDALRNDHRAALSRLLTPDELTDFDLATSPLARLLQAQLRGAPVTPEELRALYRRMQGELDGRSLAELADHPDLIEARASLFQPGGPADEILGTSRNREVQRGRDPLYRQYQNAFARAGISGAALDQVYEAHRAALRELSHVARDPNRSGPERQQLIRDSLEAVTLGLRDAVGEEAFQTLMNDNVLPLFLGRGVDPIAP